MKIKNNSKSHKKLFIVLGVVAILIVLVTLYVTYGHLSRTSNSQTAATQEEKKAGDQTKSSTVNSVTPSIDKGHAGANSSQSNNATSPNSNGVATITMKISASAQNGSIYQIRTLIESVVDDATCTLTLKKDAVVVTKTAEVQALAQSSTCRGFDIPTSELSTGIWDITVQVSGEKITGSTNGTIQVM